MRDRLGIEIAVWASGLKMTVGKRGMDSGFRLPESAHIPARKVTLTSKTLNNSIPPQLAYVCDYSHALRQMLGPHLDNRKIYHT